ncbi:MAG: hypothetical protein AAGL24_00165 [Pseudomonadota bacterium]
MPTDKEQKDNAEAERQAAVSAESMAAIERERHYQRARQELFDDSVKSLAHSAQQGGLRYVSLLSKLVVLALVVVAIVSALVALSSD